MLVIVGEKKITNNYFIKIDKIILLTLIILLMEKLFDSQNTLNNLQFSQSNPFIFLIDKPSDYIPIPFLPINTPSNDIPSNDIPFNAIPFIFPIAILQLNHHELHRYIRTNNLTHEQVIKIKKDRRKLLNCQYARNYREKKKECKIIQCMLKNAVKNS